VLGDGYLILIILNKKFMWSLLISILVVTLVLLEFTTLKIVVKSYNFDTLLGKTIVIDPGHGGIDGGTYYEEILEKNINLDISLKLKHELMKKGAIVVMTRVADESLDDHINNGSRHKEDLNKRVEIVNNSDADLVVSMHVNYSKNSNKQGPIIYYHSSDEESRDLAECLQKNLNQLSAYRKMGKKINFSTVPGNYYMLGNTIVPGVIIEAGFISNEVDRKLLLNNKHQREIVNHIIRGVVEYFGVTRYAERG